MKTVYRIIFTALFDTAIERDKAYTILKNSVPSIGSGAIVVRADMTKDEYNAPEASSEKVI